MWGIGNRSAGEVGKFLERFFKGRVFMLFNYNCGQKGKIYPPAVNKYNLIVSIISVCKS